MKDFPDLTAIESIIYDFDNKTILDKIGCEVDLKLIPKKILSIFRFYDAENDRKIGEIVIKNYIKFEVPNTVEHEIAVGQYMRFKHALENVGLLQQKNQVN